MKRVFIDTQGDIGAVLVGDFNSLEFNTVRPCHYIDVCDDYFYIAGDFYDSANKAIKNQTISDREFKIE